MTEWITTTKYNRRVLYEWCLYYEDGDVDFAKAGELEHFLPSEVDKRRYGRMPQLSLVRRMGDEGDREEAWVRENGELDIYFDAFEGGNKVPKKLMAEFEKNKALASQCINWCPRDFVELDL